MGRNFFDNASVAGLITDDPFDSYAGKTMAFGKGKFGIFFAETASGNKEGVEVVVANF